MGFTALFRFYSKVDVLLVNQYIWPIIDNGYCVLIESYKSKSNLVESIIEKDIESSSFIVFFISNNYDIYESSFIQERNSAYKTEKKVLLVFLDSKENSFDLISHKYKTDIIHLFSDNFSLGIKQLRTYVKKYADILPSPGLKVNETISLEYLFSLGKYHAAIGDYKQAYDLYRSGADKGYASAQCELAHLYIYGLGCNRSNTKAEKWLIKAAEHGNTIAQFELACYYIVGLVVKKDYREALRWLQSAAELGNSAAQEFLGKIYYQGKICKQNYNQAVYWFISSALQGKHNAQYELGNCYLLGRGVSKNYTEALKWFIKAAQNDNFDAQYMVGVCYEKGYGVAIDPEEALKWYKKAARHGHPVAINSLNKK